VHARGLVSFSYIYDKVMIPQCCGILYWSDIFVRYKNMYYSSVYRNIYDKAWVRGNSFSAV
jgi:hypothetical protein